MVSPLCQMVCSDKTQFSCDNLCGNPLSCGNHYCTKTCHALKNLSATPFQKERSNSCEECHLPCQKVFTLIFPPFLKCYVLYFLVSSPHLVDWIVSLLSDFSPLYTWVKNGCISSASSFAFTTHYLPSYFKCPHSGEKTHMFSSLPLAMSSWRMSSLQSTCKTIMSLWFNGPCLWVLILQQPVWKGADGCSLMWRTLS